MRTANPALNENTFTRLERTYADSDVMSIQGTVNKIGMLLVLTIASATWTWTLAGSESELVFPLLTVGIIGGVIFGLATGFKPTWAPVTAPIYCLLKGLFLGGISAIFEAWRPGIVFPAVCLTFGTLACMLIAYRTGLIKATENFKLGVAAATGGIFLVYLVTFLLGLFGIGQLDFIHGSGLLGIGFSLFVVVIAALNLVLDFDFIENGAARGAPKFMEWYAAFGLMVTLIWLYIEILRLLAKLAANRD
ncbi:MAG: Bax inhibitor-1/YccA family protein [Candidatus Poribacteria bacterium]|nr:Bax inhibitor-1/YccA family protein [Candidatus Poribacteria bacterium]MDE0504802.1 Bax inhibitor-1/YccA family protein [Candidatus Poribacteria bacterium]